MAAMIKLSIEQEEELKKLFNDYDEVCGGCSARTDSTHKLGNCDRTAAALSTTTR